MQRSGVKRCWLVGYREVRKIRCRCHYKIEEHFGFAIACSLLWNRNWIANILLTNCIYLEQSTTIYLNQSIDQSIDQS